MTKTKQNHKTAAEVKQQMSEESEQKVDAACAQEVQAVLESHGRALFPFIQHTDSASIARVRLVRVPQKEAEKVIE